MTTHSYTTAEARLLEAGWQCPDVDLGRVIMRREALRGAVSLLRPKAGAGTEPIGVAIVAGDADATAAAIERHILGVYLDDQLQRPEGLIFDWSNSLESQLYQFTYRCADAVLASLEGMDDRDSHYLRTIATGAQQAGGHLMGPAGRWLSPDAPKASISASMIAR